MPHYYLTKMPLTEQKVILVTLTSTYGSHINPYLLLWSKGEIARKRLHRHSASQITLACPFNRTEVVQYVYLWSCRCVSGRYRFHKSFETSAYYPCWYLESWLLKEWTEAGMDLAIVFKIRQLHDRTAAESRHCLKAWLMKASEVWRDDAEMWHQETKDVRKIEKCSH